MKPLQFAILVGAVFAGCLGGSWLALRPTEAQAQVRVENNIDVPNAGLRMLNSQGRMIGLISEVNGAGAFTLFGPNGQPSLSLLGGPGGMVTVGSSDSGSGLVAVGANGETVRIVASGGSGFISAGSAKSQVQISGGAQGAITIPGADGTALIDLRATSDGGMLKLNGGGKTLLEMLASGGKGRLSVNGDGPAGVRLDGTGLVDVLQGGRSVFSAPIRTESRPVPLAL